MNQSFVFILRWLWRTLFYTLSAISLAVVNSFAVGGLLRLEGEVRQGALPLLFMGILFNLALGVAYLVERLTEWQKELLDKE